MASKWLCLSDEERALLVKGLASQIGSEPSPKIKALIHKLEKADEKIKTASAKGKGRSLQYWICERLAELFGSYFDQQDDHCPIHSREMGQAGRDVILRGRLAGAFPYVIECKATESISLPAFIAQARKSAAAGEHSMVVVRSKVLRDPLIVIDWKGFVAAWNRPR